MGKPIGRDLDREMMAKIHTLFDRILDTVNKENPSYAFDFEQFVDCFDVEDHFTKRVFEFLVKETAQRHRSSHPHSHTQHLLRHRPPTIHHSRANTRVVSTVGPAPRSPPATDSPRIRRPHSATIFRHINSPSEMDEEHPQDLEMVEEINNDTEDDEDETEGEPGERLTAAAAGASIDSAGRSTEQTGGSLTPYTSGAALRSMLDARALTARTQNISRRSRIAHRMLSYDLMTLDRMNHNRQLLESLLTPPLPSSSLPTFSTQLPTSGNSRSGTSRSDLTHRHSSPRPPADLWDSMERAPESFRSWAETAPLPSSSSSTAYGSGSGSTFYGLQTQEPQHSPGHEWRQQQIRNVYVQHLQARGQRRSLTQELMADQASAQHQQNERQRTLQTLNGQTTTATTATTTTTTTATTPNVTALTTTAAQDTPTQQPQQTSEAQPQQGQSAQGQSQTAHPGQQHQHQQQQQQDRPVVTPAHENALLLVDTASSSPGTPAPTMTHPEPSTPLSATTTAAQAVITRPPTSSYEEFQSLTRRGREVLRNEYVNELYIEEDAQVLMTGEVSRRRRRRVGGQVMNTNDGASEDGPAQQQQQQQQQQQAQPYDIASENSNEIISQSQQQHQPQPEQPVTLPTTRPRVQFEICTSEATGSGSSTSITGSTTAGGGSHIIHGSTGLGIPTITVHDPSDANTTTTSTTTATDGTPGQQQQQQQQQQPISSGTYLGTSPENNVPPTPPSPNPNRNPRATFTDRRRSSINPADIEAIARELHRNNTRGGSGSNSANSNSSS
ncbi:hypothetical protein BGZ83_005966 [Gryganskiella cystojenkinii]|nr:hypothetical protein BGZ83_005966 [Gryganskiella cystojenkinii]